VPAQRADGGHQSVIVDAGTTVYHVARHLEGKVVR
jgi:hypothetical protein